MMGLTVLTYLLSCSAYPTHVIPLFLTRSLSPLSHFLFLLLDPGEASAGAGGAPQRATRRRRWGALRPQASGAAAAPGSERRGELRPQGERCGGGGPTAALGKRRGGEARRAGDGGGCEERRQRSKLVAGRRRRRCRRVVFFSFFNNLNKKFSTNFFEFL